ncbi:hypothetical protein AAC387_Pa01g2262 [Persea americana]
MPTLKGVSSCRFLMRISISMILLGTLGLFVYLLCLKIGLIEYFQYLLFKVGVLLAGRGLSFLLGRGRWSGILSWGVGFVLRAVIDTEATPPPGNLMLPAGASGASGSGVNQASEPLPLARAHLPLVVIPPSEVSQDELWAFVNEQPGMEAAPEMELEAAGAEKSSGSSFFGDLLDWTSPPREREIDEMLSLGGKHDAQASSSHLAQDLDVPPDLETCMKKEIEGSIENRLRTYCKRPSVAKRFPQIHCLNLDFSALAKQLAEEELDVGSKSRAELLDMFKHVQKIHEIRGLFDDLLKSLNEKEK